MVSFQCDACVDVVKKPKLDNHYSRCNSSFTCVDCSKTFHGPSQWKSHTSCVSEAEKYQKSLYKGKKVVDSDGTLGKKANVQDNDRDTENTVAGDLQGKSTDSSPSFQRPGYRRPDDRNASVPNQYNVRSGVQRQSWTAMSSMSRGGSRAGRPYGSNFGFQRSMASGANDTPLGTPLRMVSPPNLIESNSSTLPHVANTNGVGAAKADAPLAGETPSKYKDKKEKKDKSEKRRKSDLAPNLDTSAIDEAEQNGTASSTVQGPPGNNGKSITESTKKSKKRKSEALSDAVSVRQPAGTASNDLNNGVDPDSPAKDDGKKKDKKKKRKLDDAQEDNTLVEKIAQNVGADGSKKRRKEKDEVLNEPKNEVKSASSIIALENGGTVKKKNDELITTIVEDKTKKDKSKKKQKVSSKDS